MVQSVDRALAVLRLLGGGELGVSEIARQLAVDKSTISRLLGTMVGSEFVRKDRTSGKFSLGPQVAALGHAYLQNDRLSRSARALMEQVASATGETVLLAAFDGGEAVYVDKIESRHALRTYSRIGQRAPLHAGAAGKAILAFLPDADRERALGSGRLERYTAHTLTDRKQLVEHLAEVRRVGYAVGTEEIHEGVVGIGVPLRDQQGSPLGAISVTGPLLRFEPALIQSTIILLRRAAADWQPPWQR